MFDSQQARQLVLERRNLGTKDELLAIAHSCDGGKDLLAQRAVLCLQVEQRHSHHRLAHSSWSGYRRALTAARVSRSASRRLMVSRLSYSFFPLARLTATFTRPFLKYMRSGTRVMPRSTVLPISLRIS